MLFLRFDDDIPCGSIEQIEEKPQPNHCEEPVASMLQALPYLLEWQLGYHHGEYYNAEDEECVLVFLFQNMRLLSVSFLRLIVALAIRTVKFFLLLHPFPTLCRGGQQANTETVGLAIANQSFGCSGFFSCALLSWRC